MSGVMTNVGINDGMSNVLKNMLANMNLLTSSFQRMQSIASQGLPTNTWNGIVEDINRANVALVGYQNNLRALNSTHISHPSIGSISTIPQPSMASSNNWNNLQGISTINSFGSERLQREMNDYKNMVTGISNLQDKLKTNIGSMDRSLLPQSAISDIAHAENRVNSLIQSMQRMSRADMSLLNNSQIESMNSSFESMRQNASALINTISGINSNLPTGNLNTINSGFQQLNTLASQAEQQIRNASQALNSINSTRNWNGINPFEVMQGSGRARLQAEIDSYKNHIAQLNNLQSSININSSPIRSLLPPNAISDIEQAQNRLNSLMSSMQGISGINMSALNSSQIDSMSNVFEGLRRHATELQTIMSGIGNNISTNNVEALNASFQRLNALTEQAETQIRNTGQVLNDLNAINPGTTQLQQTFDNYKRIVTDINKMRDTFNSDSFKELIPQSSIMNATRAEGVLNSLASTIWQMRGMNVELLNPSQTASMQASFEALRHGAENIQTTMANIGTNINTGNFTSLNEAFYQLINFASQAEQQIRTTSQAVASMNNVHWAGISGGQELFNSTGQLRALQEMSSLNQMFQRLKQSQDQITQNASSMSILPPNAQRDFDLLNSRVYQLSNTIRALEREKSRLSSFDVSGINSFNNRIESLRSHLQSALTTQERINSAISSSSFENVNRGAMELNNILNNIGRQIRENNDQQQQFNTGISNTQTGAKSLLSVGDKFGMALANNIVNSAQQVLNSGINKIIEVTESSFKNGLNLIKSERELQARLGNDTAGTGLYKILAQDAKTSAFNEMQMMKAASSYLPYTQNIKQIQDLNRITEILSMFDKTGQGANGAMFAMRELIGGNTRSLAMRFDIPAKLLRSFDLDKLGFQDMDKFIEQTYKLLDALNMTGDAYKKMLEAPSTQLEMFSTNLETAFAKASKSGIENLTPLIKRANGFLESPSGDKFFNTIEDGFTNMSNTGVRAFNILDQHSDSLIESLDSILTASSAIGNSFMTAAEWISNNYETVQKYAGIIQSITRDPLTLVLTFNNVYDEGLKWINMFINLKANIEITKLEFKHLGDFVANTLDTLSMNFLVLKISVLNQFNAIKIGGIQIFQDLVNSIIDGLNYVSGFFNDRIGTNFENIEHTKLGNSEIYNTLMGSVGQNLQDYLAFFEKQQAIYNRNQDLENERQKIKDEATRQKNIAEASMENYRNRFKDKGGDSFNYDEINKLFKTIKGSSPLGLGSDIDKVGNVGNVGSVDKISEPINFSNEDLQSLREFADIDSINQFTQQTLAPQITITFGDIKETVDVSKVLDEINEKLIEQMAASSDKVPIT